MSQGIEHNEFDEVLRSKMEEDSLLDAPALELPDEVWVDISKKLDKQGRKKWKWLPLLLLGSIIAGIFLFRPQERKNQINISSEASQFLIDQNEIKEAWPSNEPEQKTEKTPLPIVKPDKTGAKKGIIRTELISNNAASIHSTQNREHPISPAIPNQLQQSIPASYQDNSVLSSIPNPNLSLLSKLPTREFSELAIKRTLSLSPRSIRVEKRKKKLAIDLLGTLGNTQFATAYIYEHQSLTQRFEVNGKGSTSLSLRANYPLNSKLEIGLSAQASEFDFLGNYTLHQHYFAENTFLDQGAKIKTRMFAEFPTYEGTVNSDLTLAVVKNSLHTGDIVGLNFALEHQLRLYSFDLSLAYSFYQNKLFRSAIRWSGGYTLRDQQVPTQLKGLWTYTEALVPTDLILKLDNSSSSLRESFYQMGLSSETFLFLSPTFELGLSIQWIRYFQAAVEDLPYEVQLSNLNGGLFFRFNIW